MRGATGNRCDDEPNAEHGRSHRRILLERATPGGPPAGDNANRQIASMKFSRTTITSLATAGCAPEYERTRGGADTWHKVVFSLSLIPMPT
jgi:hypothetical protein